ncbi:MAG TPA: Hpt domain-containing protein [Polyangia bacterium]|nr:Hpt domain-containing protein [Polyangia bacterium]
MGGTASVVTSDDGAQGAAGAVLVDEARVALLRRDPAEWAEILALYRQYAAELLAAIEQDVGRGAPALVVRHVHQLKGCSANMGLIAAAARCAELEERLRKASPTNLDELVAGLREIVERSAAALG